MSFKKFVGIVQILFSLILVAIPTTALVLLRKYSAKVIEQILNLTPKELLLTGQVTPPLQDILLILQGFMIFILIIFSLIALSLFLQGVVNIKE